METSRFNLVGQDWDLRLLTCFALTVVGPFLLTWLLTSWRASRAVTAARTTTSELKHPPTLPYLVPILGHLFQFMWNGHSFMLKASTYFGRTFPVKIVLPSFSNYVVSGPEFVNAYFRESKDLSTTSRSIAIMVNGFGCPSHLVDAFKPQTRSAGSAENSSTALEEDVEQLIHRSIRNGLSGLHLDSLTARFQHYLQVQSEADLACMKGDEWTGLPDLNGFVEKHVFEAAIGSMFGTHILSLNPTLAEDFWNFNRVIKSLFMGLPRWTNPAAYRARDKMLESIQKWQTYAGQHCDIARVGDVEWEPYYGSKFIRERQVLLTKRGIVDERARAAENFAFMWATNSNSVPAATWFILEILQDPALQARVRASLPAMSHMPVEKSAPSTSLPAFDVSKLCSNPLLQSLYAETLRLRVAVLILREPAKDNFSFRGWHIKRNEVLSVSTRSEAMDQEVWSTGGEGDPHPLDTLWPDRFIVDPKDPNSGPLRSRRRRKELAGVASPDDGKAVGGGEAYFSMDGLSTSWIPYGGGTSLCPGRHFAKREIITTAAILLDAFEMELLEGKGKKRPDVDMSCFGFGTMPPDKAIPFKIRRRHH